MTRQRSMRLQRLGAPESEVEHREKGKRVYRVPSLLHLIFKYIIEESILHRRLFTIEELVTAMPYMSFTQRKFMDELERQVGARGMTSGGEKRGK